MNRPAILLLVVLMVPILAFSQDQARVDSNPPCKRKTTMTKQVQTACGKCQFGMKDDGCHLAVKLEGKAYFVDGFDIDGFGDAHADDGFCNAVRYADVKGHLVNGRFHAHEMVLVEKAAKKKM